MNLCVSNIAWSPAQDEAALEQLASLGVKYIELAPTRWWPDLSRVTDDQISSVQTQWSRSGLRAVAFQAVLFGQPQLSIFQDSTRAACLEYLKAVTDLAARMGVTAIVFGSPKNRLRGSRTSGEVLPEAVAFFQTLGQHAAERNVRFCFEPNPAEYGADFGCTLLESTDLVDAVNSPGIWLNVDAGAIRINQEDPTVVISRASGRIGHFHISEPFLGDFTEPKGDHHSLAKMLQQVGYDGIISIEMKAQPTGMAAVVEAVRYARSVYLC